MAVGDFVGQFGRISQKLWGDSNPTLRRLYREARRAPEDLQSLTRLCRELDHRGKREDALVQVRDFMQRTGERELEGVGALLCDLNAYEMAELCYTRLTELQPDRAAHMCWLGIVHAKQGDAGRAKEELERALELEPRNAETLVSPRHLPSTPP